MKKIARSQALSLAEMLLLNIKKGTEYEQHLTDLAEFPPDELIAQLNTENKKKAFWINIYNAFFQVLAQTQSELLENKGRLYKGKHLAIAGEYLSLDDIEHGILRKRKFKYGLGYIRSFFSSDFVKSHQVGEVDYRIHFALNCGAVSCPPIAFYQYEKLDEKLDLASESFLEQDCQHNKDSKTLYISRLMLWFLGDFGGISGIYQMLEKYNIIQQAQRPKLRFKSYNWDLHLDNWR